MPTNLHALIRYRTLDRCLRDQEYDYHWPDLARACEEELSSQMGIEKKLSRRTIMYDLQHMKSGKLGYEAPIAYDRKEGYYYTIPNFNIHHLPLSAHDQSELKTALLILKQFAGNEQITGLENVLTKLEHSLNIKKSRQEHALIQFEHSLNEPGHRWLNRFYLHIKAKNTLVIRYQPFGKEPKHITMSPYLIKEYDNRWFVIGHSEDYNGIITLGLDRVLQLQKSLKKYHLSTDFIAAEWFENIIGVSKLRNVQKELIKFRAFGLQVNYLLTKPIHPSQRMLKKRKHSADFSIEVIPNYELISTFLSFGEAVEVLKPISLRNDIVAKISSMSIRYK